MPRDGAFGRAVLGEAADVSMDTHLLALVAHLLAGANWQRGGGKGSRPKRIELPDGRRKPRRDRAEQAVTRLRNLGLIPDAPDAPAGRTRTPSPAELQRHADEAWLARQKRLAQEK